MADKIIVVAGPTASGKTALGIDLALRYNGEIVSADSMQIYRRMDIGTAKATADERAQVPHHMLDVAEPDEDYSVARYVEQAEECCRDIIARGKLPIVVGGTGLYIDSLVSGRDFAAKDSDEDLRERLTLEYNTIGGEAMLERLRAVDPERANKLHPSDSRRIARQAHSGTAEAL
jgi:tRNA dimethylallyltransferase